MPSAAASTLKFRASYFSPLYKPTHLSSITTPWTLSTFQSPFPTWRSTTLRKFIDPLYCAHSTNPHSTQQNQVNSPLLRLPSEIRNLIYAYAFSSATLKRDSIIVAAAIYPAGYRTSTRYYTVRDGAVLRRLCRQTRSEVRPFQLDNLSTRVGLGCHGKWFDGIECSKIEDMEMSYQLAEALHDMVRHESNCGWHPNLGEMIERGVFSNLQRVVVTCSESDLEDLCKIESVRWSLLGLLQKAAPEVYIKLAGSQVVHHGTWWKHGDNLGLLASQYLWYSVKFL